MSWRDGGQVELFTSELPESNSETNKGRLYYKAQKVIKYDNNDYFYYTLNTKITWQLLNSRDSLVFTVDQIVFN